MDAPASKRFLLRDLPLSARFALSAFLVSVGLGYLAALVQLHYQDARKGELMPGAEDAVRKFHDKNFGMPAAPAESRPQGRIEELITADPKLKFGGKFQMRTAFTTDSDDWESDVEQRAKELKVGEKEAIKSLEPERDGERLAMIDWLHSDDAQKTYEADSFPLPPAWKKDQPITAKYAIKDGKDVTAVKIRSIFKDRCTVCHEEPNGRAANHPMANFEQIKKFLAGPPTRKATGSQRRPGIGIEKLAQTTHVHMLGFAMLYGLTGILLAFTSYPAFLRVFLAPLPLTVQAIEIICWWLGRLDAPYGIWACYAVAVTGGIVAAGVFLHIMLTLFDLYHGLGKLVLVLLLGGAAAAGVVCLKPIVERELQDEKPQPAAVESATPNDAAKAKPQEAPKGKEK